MEAKEFSTIPVRLDVLGPQAEIVQTNEFVKDKIVLGRILSADLRIDDPRVSRIHALIEIRNDKILITDLDSSHGTFVNGEKVVEHTLKFGDTIRLGFLDIRVLKGSGNVTTTHPASAAIKSDSDDTLINIERSDLENLDRREPVDRRKHDAIPEEERLSERREGDRRIDQRQVERRQSETKDSSSNRREGQDRRTPRGENDERRVGERRQSERRVFDITSLERRIQERRARRSDDDILPSELEKAFEAPEHARELEITALWGDHILDVSNYAKPATLTAGESPRNTYIIPCVGISDEFPLVTIEQDGTAHLAFTEELTGTVRARDKIYTLAQLKEEKFVKRSGDHYVVPLKQDDFAKLAIGKINFFILYVKPAPRIKTAPFFEKDALMLRTMIGSALFLALFLITVSLIPKPKPVTIEMIPERFAKIVIKKRPVIPPVKMVVEAPGMDAKEGGSVAGEGGPAIGPEGRAGNPNLADKKEVPQAVLPKSKPKDKTAPAPPTKVAAKPTDRQRKVVDSNKVKSVGLLGAFKNSSLQKDVKNLIDTGAGPEGPGGFDDFGKAVKGARGKSIEDTGGAGGMGLKGVDVGGGGKTIGIDGPSTKGLGRGYHGDGIGEGISGPGRLGLKGEHAISIISENVQVLSGLPKDVINAVVQRHRGEIRACYDSALQGNPNLRGKVTMAFTIQPDGIVSSASVKESTVGSERLESCITSRVKTWIFPKPEAPVVTEVTAYPFYLNPSN